VPEKRTTKKAAEKQLDVQPGTGMAMLFKPTGFICTAKHGKITEVMTFDGDMAHDGKQTVFCLRCIRDLLLKKLQPARPVK